MGVGADSAEPEGRQTARGIPKGKLSLAGVPSEKAVHCRIVFSGTGMDKGEVRLILRNPYSFA